jgi:hypothetical protein
MVRPFLPHVVTESIIAAEILIVKDHLNGRKA